MARQPGINEAEQGQADSFRKLRLCVASTTDETIGARDCDDGAGAITNKRRHFYRERQWVQT